jgi:Tol biopolymer transport system component
VSSSELTANISATELATAGTVDVTVVTPGPGGGVSNAQPFTVAANRIAFASSRALDGSNSANGSSIPVLNVWTMNADGSGALPITRHVSVAWPQPTQVQWAPDGSRIVFPGPWALDGTEALNVNATFNIWVIRADGTGLTPLTKLTAAQTDTFSAQWSPDGHKIAFTSARALDGGDKGGLATNVWVMNADGSGPVPATKLTAAVCMAHSWSPNGDRLLFASNRALDGSDAANANDHWNLWIVNADGTGAVPVTRLTGAGFDNNGLLTGYWSPDGKRITYDSGRAIDGSDAPNANASRNIWISNADGSNSTPLTKLTATDGGFRPQWSPDGRRILFFSARALDGSDAANATTNLWVMNSDGSSPTPITHYNVSGLAVFAAVWSADGQRLVFESNDTLDGSPTTWGPINIWTANPDGSGVVPLTSLTASGADSYSPNVPGQQL